MTLTDLLVPTYRNMLQTLIGLLDKAEAQLGAEKAEALLSARLAPDMFPLATHLMAPLMETATITGELLGTPNAQIRRNLTGDQPKLFEPWIALSDEEPTA